ncbi:unnamed protein product [marine sediment metagenome]|uniref:Uncharacterized protein n=1 Tax=marine sediment metagenome TaxID=412755 RepID=X0YND2_9ZZZZ
MSKPTPAQSKLIQLELNLANALDIARTLQTHFSKYVMDDQESPSTITSPMHRESGENPCLDDRPLRTQLLHEGKPIPASGTAAAELVAAARAEGAKQKRESSKDTESE